MSDESLDTQSSQINLNLKFPTYGQSLHKSKASQTRVRFQWNLHWIHRQNSTACAWDRNWMIIYIHWDQTYNLSSSTISELLVLFIWSPHPILGACITNPIGSQWRSIYLSAQCRNNWLPKLGGVCFYYLGKLFLGN